MNIGIYKITSPSGKIYIGQSIQVKKRFEQYRYLDCKKQPKLFNSFKKYGPENHKFEIIEECSVEQLNEREIYWKKYYLNLFNNNWKLVLFHELYDTGGGPRSEETKQKLKIPKPQGFGEKISRIKKGHICYKDYKRGEKIGLANSKPKPEGFGLEQSKKLLGKKRSEETKQRMKKPKSKYKKREGKSILQYDLEGNFIKEWSSIKEAAKELKIGSGNIVEIIKGHIKHPKKHIFKYK